jgi:hypothetical protein
MGRYRYLRRFNRYVYDLFLLFCRFFPVIAIAEVKSIFRTSSETAKRERALKEGSQNGGFVGHMTIGVLNKDDNKL